MPEFHKIILYSKQTFVTKVAAGKTAIPQLACKIMLWIQWG